MVIIFCLVELFGWHNLGLLFNLDIVCSHSSHRYVSSRFLSEPRYDRRSLNGTGAHIVSLSIQLDGIMCCEKYLKMPQVANLVWVNVFCTTSCPVVPVHICLYVELGRSPPIYPGLISIKPLRCLKTASVHQK